MAITRKRSAPTEDGVREGVKNLTISKRQRRNANTPNEVRPRLAFPKEVWLLIIKSLFPDFHGEVDIESRSFLVISEGENEQQHQPRDKSNI